MSDFPVYYFNESLRGAPQVSGTAGALIAVLDACLITGFGSVAVTGITVADGVATCTVNSGDTFAAHHIIEISGATPSELNGRHRVLPGATLTKFEFETDAASGAASGTITAKYAAAEGWEKVFSGSNKAVYRATTGNRFYYRINDDFTQKYVAEVRGYELMYDVDTGDAPFPVTRTSTIEKSNGSNATPKYWDLFADNRLVCFGAQQAPTIGNTPYTSPYRMFGEFVSFSTVPDAWISGVASSNEVSSNASPNNATPAYANNGSAEMYLASIVRDISGVGAAQYCNFIAEAGETSGLSGYDLRDGNMPSAVDGAIFLCRSIIRQTNDIRRGYVPGFWYNTQRNARELFNVRDVLIPETGPLAGRRLIALSSNSGNSPSTSGSSGRYFVDITGPWR